MSSLPSNHLKLRKVTPVRVFEHAVEQIREFIRDGSLVPGQKLPTEQELCRELNVSRSSVREALRVLEAEGLVEVKRGSGTFVAAQTSPHAKETELAHWLSQREESLEQVLQVREFIEGLSASLASVRATNEELANIRAIYNEQLTVISQVMEEAEKANHLAVLDSKFHRAISSASKNDIAEEIISHILPAFVEGNKAVLYLSRRSAKLVTEHAQILAALEAHDPAGAEKAIRRHICRVRKDLLAIKTDRKC